jgi:hypothetical protein
LISGLVSTRSRLVAGVRRIAVTKLTGTKSSAAAQRITGLSAPSRRLASITVPASIMVSRTLRRSALLNWSAGNPR